MKPAGGSPPGSECDWAEPALSFEDLLRRNTGWAQTPERWREQRRRRQLLEAETARIADALEAEGIPVRLDGSDVMALGDVTGLVAPVESYRAFRFLPSSPSAIAGRCSMGCGTTSAATRSAHTFAWLW